MEFSTRPTKVSSSVLLMSIGALIIRYPCHRAGKLRFKRMLSSYKTLKNYAKYFKYNLNNVIGIIYICCFIISLLLYSVTIFFLVVFSNKIKNKIIVVIYNAICQERRTHT